MRHHRYSISLTDEQNQAAKELMQIYFQPDMASLFNVLMVESYRNNIAKKQGKKDERPVDDSELRVYPHPDQLMNKGKMLTREELEEWYLAKGEHMPDY